MEKEAREKAKRGLTKWDIFRKEKSKHLDFASALIKKRALIKRLLGFIQIG